MLDHDSSIFRFLRNFHTVLYSGYTNLHSTSSVRGFHFLHTHLAFIVCAHFDAGHSGCLIFISVIISDVKSLFICFWPSVCLLGSLTATS